MTMIDEALVAAEPVVDGEVHDMTDAVVENYRANKLDALVCLGGGGAPTRQAAAEFQRDREVSQVRGRGGDRQSRDVPR